MKRSFECLESVSRRTFLKASAMLSFAALPDLSFAEEPAAGRLLVILLRGGMDGLFAMPPVGDPNLKRHRRDLMPDGLRKLDGFFALHPALENIHQAYQDGQALLVHGTSYPYTGRSHFEGQDIMESGRDIAYSSPSGWLGRALEVAGQEPAVSMSLPVPLILRGSSAAESSFPTWIRTPAKTLYEKIEPIWAGDPDLADFGHQLAEAARMPGGMMASGRPNQNTPLSRLAREAAQRLARNDGPRVAVLDHVDFDTHAGQPGLHSDRLREVDEAIGAFRRAIGKDIWQNTLVLTVTEFGRTVDQNGSWGTDHGWGSCIFALGGLLKKSGTVADWPGLRGKDLYDGRDLKATLDARALYAAALGATLSIAPDRVAAEVMDFEKTDAFEAYL